MCIIVVIFVVLTNTSRTDTMTTSSPSTEAHNEITMLKTSGSSQLQPSTSYADLPRSSHCENSQIWTAPSLNKNAFENLPNHTSFQSTELGTTLLCFARLPRRWTPDHRYCARLLCLQVLLSLRIVALHD